ncbi:MAG: hypothetical protein RLY87_449 [Chloroflexota bacterium]|jgi:hypothetical protein
MRRFLSFLQAPKKDWRHWALFLVVLGLLGRCSERTPQTSAPAKTVSEATATIPLATSTRVPTRAPSATLEPPTPIIDANDRTAIRLERIVYSTLERNNSDGKPRLVGIEALFGATPDIDGHRLIRIRANRNITNNLMVIGMLIDAVELFARIAENDVMEELDSVTIMFTLPMIDKYGNAVEADVNRIQLTTDTMRRINWERFKNGGHRRLVDAADQYVLNPALR